MALLFIFITKHHYYSTTTGRSSGTRDKKEKPKRVVAASINILIIFVNDTFYRQFSVFRFGPATVGELVKNPPPPHRVPRTIRKISSLYTHTNTPTRI